MKAKKLLSGAGLLLLSFNACDFDIGGNYDFESTAVYVAPKTGSTAIVFIKGYVPNGADLGNENKCQINAIIKLSVDPTERDINKKDRLRQSDAMQLLCYSVLSRTIKFATNIKYKN
jgi:hypothetical protein